MISRRRFIQLFGALVGAGALGLPGRPAEAQVYYDQFGNPVAVNTGTLGAPVTVYDVNGRPVTLYPARPTYVHTPQIYGPAGVRGQARRVSRRTARRVSRRR